MPAGLISEHHVVPLGEPQRLEHRAEKMVSETQQNSPLSRDVQLDTDDQLDVESLLESLSNGSLARLIIDAAQLAVAEHMLLTAQENQFAVEAENSTKPA